MKPQLKLALALGALLITFATVKAQPTVTNHSCVDMDVTVYYENAGGICGTANPCVTYSTAFATISSGGNTHTFYPGCSDAAPYRVKAEEVGGFDQANNYLSGCFANTPAVMTNSCGPGNYEVIDNGNYQLDINDF